MNTVYTVVLFGEAEKGEFQTAYLCQELADLDQYFGNPPSQSQGLYCAIQALLFKRQLIYFRVLEEGFSKNDYLVGLQLLENQTLISNLDAIYMPGIGDQFILEAAQPICASYHSILLTNEADFYDYLHFK
jgi:hypothetical protein